MIGLGDKVKDVVSGYVGTAIAKIIFLNNCIQFHVQAKGVKKDGEPIKAQWVDEEQLIVVKKKNINIVSEPTGGGIRLHPGED